MIVISVIWFLSANERSEDTRLGSVIFSALKLIFRVLSLEFFSSSIQMHLIKKGKSGFP